MKSPTKSFKKLAALALAFSLGASSLLTAYADGDAGETADGKSAADYSYKIRALLGPFNEYFFVETDNPDPFSFRFADKSSKYAPVSENDGEEVVGDGTVVLAYDTWEDQVKLFADVKYDDPETGRVSGGYIFQSFNTDGGEIVLQEKEPSSDPSRYWDYSWEDTPVTLVLPPLVDDVDYLINTYADKDSFFDNMDAVQAGFSSICLYSGSNIRGTLEKTSDYWKLSVAGHKDQSFYIFSPYSRRDSRSLFATAIYPFRYDSLGFPSVMGRVSQRLDSESDYKWDSDTHYLINVTYNGETRSYGGAGVGEGQGVSEDKIIEYFTFGEDGKKFTLSGSKQLLQEYASIKMSDDIPREDSLTWKQIYDECGSGMWARIGGGFAYFYQNGNGDNFSEDEWGVGYSLYWGGDLGYACDTWVDGRYVDEWRTFEKGAKLEDHPTSSIILDDFEVPLITCDYSYNYDPETESYVREYSEPEIKLEKRKVRFYYNSEKEVWTPSLDAFKKEDGSSYDYNTYYNDYYADYSSIAEMVEQGVLDAKYLDMISLTFDEVKAMGVDRNTDIYPDEGRRYDGNCVPGTVGTKLSYELDGWEWDGLDKATATFKSLNEGEPDETFTVGAVLDGREEPTCEDDGKVIYRAQVEFDGVVYNGYEYDTLPKLGHDYKVEKWDWNGYDSVKVRLVCQNDPTHVIEDEVYAYAASQTDPTCEEDGEIIHVAQYYFWEGDRYLTDTRCEPLPKVGHKYQPYNWIWNDDGTAEAELYCANDYNHMKTVPATVTKAATDDGNTLLTASIVIDGVTYTDRKTVKGILPDPAPDTDTDTSAPGGDPAKPDTDSASDKPETDTSEDRPGTDPSSPDKPAPDSDPDSDTDGSDPSDAPVDGDVYGDVDFDGFITSTDALMILRASIGTDTLSARQFAVADIDAGGVIMADDALAVLRYSIGLIDEGSRVGSKASAK